MAEKDEPTQTGGEVGGGKTTQTGGKLKEGKEGDVAGSGGVGAPAVDVLAWKDKREANRSWYARGVWDAVRDWKESRVNELVGGGATLSAARKQAARESLLAFPPPAEEASRGRDVPDPTPVEPTPVKPTPAQVDSLGGFGDLPADWPELPANASLQAEISWVSANRLRVRDGGGVDLSRALSPAPSYAALSWLETSIQFPSKFADISVKATQNAADEGEQIRREKLQIEEIRSILAEMLEE